MTRIAFTADLHIDQYGHRRDPASGMNARLVDYLGSARSVAQTARDQDCEALIVAGDVTERRHAEDWLLRHIKDALSDFSVGRPDAAGILLRGNHDEEIAGESKVSALADMLRWTAVSRPSVRVIGDVVLVLMPYLDRHSLRATEAYATAPDAEVYLALNDAFVAIARGMYAQVRSAHPRKACVLVIHQTLSGGWMSDTQRAYFGEHGLVIDTGALAAIGYEAVVAGHLHRHQVIPAPIPVLYTGAIERVDFGEQDQDKGFVIADIEPGRFEWRFVETFARRYVTVSVTDGDITAAIVAAGGVADAIVRVRDLPAEADAAGVRTYLEQLGAFEVKSIERHRPALQVVEGGIAESLSPYQAIEAYVGDHPDRERLLELGRRLLQATAA